MDRWTNQDALWNNKCPTNLHSRYLVNHSLSQCSTLMKPIFLIVKSSWSYFNDQYRVWVYQLVNFNQDGTTKGWSVMVKKLTVVNQRLVLWPKSGSNLQCIVKSSTGTVRGPLARLKKYDSYTKLYEKYKCKSYYSRQRVIIASSSVV